MSGNSSSENVGVGVYVRAGDDEPFVRAGVAMEE
jgi:hypothetical protein